jgi:hypothetical protein
MERAARVAKYHTGLFQFSVHLFFYSSKYKLNTAGMPDLAQAAGQNAIHAA